MKKNKNNLKPQQDLKRACLIFLEWLKFLFVVICKNNTTHFRCLVTLSKMTVRAKLGRLSFFLPLLTSPITGSVPFMWTIHKRKSIKGNQILHSLEQITLRKLLNPQMHLKGHLLNTLSLSSISIQTGLKISDSDWSCQWSRKDCFCSVIKIYTPSLPQSRNQIKFLIRN